MNLPSSRRIFAALLLFFVAAPPAFAQRQRPVRRDSVELSGRVTDASSQAPVFGAVVRAEQQSATADNNGNYVLTGLSAGQTEVVIERWGYEPKTVSVNLQRGANTLNTTLVPRPTLRAVLKNGTTFTLDYDSFSIVYIPPLQSYRAVEIILCQPDGNASGKIEFEEMKTLSVIGTRTDSSSCCSLAPGALLRIERRDGSIAEGTLKATCFGDPFFALGRNRANGKWEEIPLQSVERLEF